jgi:hypothetical protein
MGGENAKPVPEIREFNEGRWIQGARKVACHFLRALEITYDGAHVYFVHPSHPATTAANKSGVTEDRAELRLTQNGCIQFSPATNEAADPIPENSGTMEYSIPGRIHFVWPLPQQKYYMNFFVTPIGETHCRIDYLVQNFDPKGKQLFWSEGPSDIIDEDVDILEATQKSYEAEGENFEMSVEADVGPLTVRKIVKLALKGHWEGLASDLPKRRVFGSVRPQEWGMQ